MGLCQKCRSVGLPIYPVRYAVAPEYVITSLPSWAENKQLPTLSKHSKYVLRTMRKGYLYVFCQYEGSGSDLDVLAYKVDEQGGFWQQDISKELDLLRFGESVDQEQQSVPLDDIQTTCDNSAHSASNIAFITLAKPEKCDMAWLAFSEHKWSAKTLKKYLNDKDKRNLRMQAIKPKQWLNSQESKNGITTANQEAIASTMEIQNIDDTLDMGKTNLPDLGSRNYAINFPYLFKNSPLDKVPLSESRIPDIPTFKYNSKLLKKRSTLNPWLKISKEIFDQTSSNKSYSTHLNKKMKSVERNSTGSPPMMVALIDSIGIAAELSNWHNSSIYSVTQVEKERQRENAACRGIEILEDVIKNSDYSNNKQNYKEYIRNKNRKYLEDAKYYNRKDFTYDSSILGEVPQWGAEQKSQGQRVINIVNKSKQYLGSSQYVNPYLTDIEREVNGIKSHAASVVQFVNENYPIEEIGEERHARVFQQIFALDKNSKMTEINELKAKLTVIEVEFRGKAEAYELSWHKENKTIESGQKSWQKYENCLSRHYRIYKQQYAIFLQESKNYITDLLDDLILWVDCSKQKEKHPLSLSADDFAQDSDDYLAFANDILMSLSMKGENKKVTQLFTQLMEDEALDGHNIVWSAVLADRKMDKTEQQKCVSLLLSLDKSGEFGANSCIELLNQLEKVVNFYQGESEESNALVELGNSFDSRLPEFMSSKNESNALEAVQEVLTAFETSRNTLLDDSSIDTEISASAFLSIKKASSAAVGVLLTYLRKIGGKLSSKFAQAFHIVSMPKRVSKSSIRIFIDKFTTWTTAIKTSMRLENGFNLVKVWQGVNDKLKKFITNKKVGASFTGVILGIHLVKIYSIVTDDSFKTQAQQSREKMELTMAITASVSASFRLVVIYGENNCLSDKVLKNVNFLGNFFGFIYGVFSIVVNWNEDTSDKQAFEVGLHDINLFSSFVSTVDLFLQMGKTSLIQVLDRGVASLGTLLAKRTLIGSFVTLGGRLTISVIALALNPWITLGIFFIQLVITLNKPDDMQKWLTSCCFGKGQNGLHDEHYYRYKTSKEEMDALEAIFEKYQQELEEYYAEQEAERAKRETPVITGPWPVFTYPIN